MSTASDHTITCNIKGITHQATVEWKSGTAVISTDVDYEVDHGTIKISNSQEATLTITATGLDKLGATATFTCKASSGANSKSDVVTLTILKFG